MRIAVVNKVLVVSGCCRAQTATTTETRSPQPMAAVVATGAVDKRVAVAVPHLPRSTGAHSPHHVFWFDWLLLNLMLETVAAAAAAVQGVSG